MKGKDKKELIFDAAVELISERGANNFSLNNVSHQAGISKGGLLYHFPTKEELLRGLHNYIIQFIKEKIEEESKKGGSYTQSYIGACYGITRSKEIRAYSSLMNYEWDQSIEGVWNDLYIEVTKKLSKELPEEWITLIALITDGLWTKASYYSEKELNSAFAFLMKLVHK
ncbi:transcriptional regulator, TetR family [Terribacillus aidingensis]|uniref:Transcriptional regulator, TetR family n=1 Tax=Terribacillus aidingensis TaxID=586416 RepID=A0A285NKV7_9BACI|nr:helix-turn-helix domain-containing protein [Terribacillus aidingensis]SNZ10164.1 transcriptional regulator, TetR family [Terribacillus aidingensis]